MKSDSSKEDESYVNIEYLTWPIIRYKREVLFGWVDLLVSFGGIAGLFLGFSLLSGVEIIYYFTMRAFCMLYKNRVTQTVLTSLMKDSSYTFTFFRTSCTRLKRKNCCGHPSSMTSH
jgi:Amiloride-sensitive sodium channel